jgi:hypothetical protein
LPGNDGVPVTEICRNGRIPNLGMPQGLSSAVVAAVGMWATYPSAEGRLAE